MVSIFDWNIDYEFYHPDTFEHPTSHSFQKISTRSTF